jgi:flagellar biosynthetic protein FliP
MYSIFSAAAIAQPASMANATGGLSPLFESLRLTTPVEVFLTLTALSFLPVLVVALTTFTRNIIVLSFLRQGLGLQQSPPNIVLISLATFLTFFTMSPVFDQSYREGLNPYMKKELSAEVALERSWIPFRNFLLHQTRESDLALVHELGKTPLPDRAEDVKPSFLIPAFMLSELKTAFQIGFVIFLPFLLIDIVIASILMSLGMIMVPPVTIALPIKILLFVVVDGWALIAKTLIASVGT